MSECGTISRRAGYTAIPNHIFSDDRLTLEARAFLGLIMSMKEGWVFRRNNLMKTAGIGRDKYRRIVKELQSVGYLEIQPVHGDDGRFIGNHWVIDDEPPTLDVDTGGLKTSPSDTGGLKTSPSDTGGLKNRRSVLPDSGETRPLKNNNSLKKPNKKETPLPPERGKRAYGVSENVKKILENHHGL